MARGYAGIAPAAAEYAEIATRINGLTALLRS